jgi:precorrin-2 dehydrogenase/sirohydrochlorin ferrochelatase
MSADMPVGLSGSVRFSYALMLDLSGRTVVIVGGGGVAARKAKGLLEAGVGRLRVVSPEFSPEIPEGVERVSGAYEAKWLEGAALVFAATDRAEVNAAVVRDAKRLGILVNRADADSEDGGDFSTPAVLREGDLVVTVSAGGSPGLAAAVRDGLRERMEKNWAAMAAVLRELRPRILASEAPIEWRRNALKDLLSEEAMEIAGRGGDAEELWLWVKERNRGI